MRKWRKNEDMDGAGGNGRIAYAGAVSVGLMLGENFVVNVRKLTNSVDHIRTEALKECYQNFLKAFEN